MVFKVIIAVFLGIHGAIHLLGFVKGFGLAEIEELKQPVSKQRGIHWMVVFLLFAVSAVLLVLHLGAWMIVAAIAVIASQLAIISSWDDAKFGTIANAIVVLVLIGAGIYGSVIAQI